MTSRKNLTAKYRILKTTRDETALMGVDYTPEYKENDVWVSSTPAMYSYEDAVEYLRKKAQNEIKTEYIYLKL